MIYKTKVIINDIWGTTYLYRFKNQTSKFKVHHIWKGNYSWSKKQSTLKLIKDKLNDAVSNLNSKRIALPK